jgi:hypothetical protein
MDSWSMPYTRRQAMGHKHLSHRATNQDHSSVVGKTNGEEVAMVESVTGTRL